MTLASKNAHDSKWTRWTASNDAVPIRKTRRGHDMKKDDYWQKPKKARGKSCNAWWYANATNMEIHAGHADGGHCIAVLTRRQLAEYLRRSDGDKQP